ncbi:MAG: hypothetical protein CM15mP93_10340 [Thiotrichaceae bacterium]|nr:MAG: hypothetical protein CM15mP93_10340 [Thiotrichaceae bacterium]
MNRALLIVAHGSRRKESNIEVIQLAARIRRKIEVLVMLMLLF